MIKTSGRTTRTSVLWLAQADLEAFSNALRASMPGLAWRCSHVGDERGQSRLHGRLSDALQCPYGSQLNPDSQQASVMLPMQANGEPTERQADVGQEGAHQAHRPFAGMGLLLMNFSSRSPQHVVPARDFGPSANLADWPTEFHQVPESSLAITWDWADGDARSRVAMDEQVRHVWRVLHRVTQRVQVRSVMPGAPAALRAPHWLPVRSRIGPQMASQMREHGWCLRDGPLYCLANSRQYGLPVPKKLEAGRPYWV